MVRAMFGFLVVLAGFGPAHAQMPFGVQPPAAALEPAALFRNQCGTCHATEAGAPPRQGPNLAGVYMRPAGKLPQFKYSTGFASQDFIWDNARLDAWLTNPQAMIPGTIMVYRQAKPETRRIIIAWLKEQH